MKSVMDMGDEHKVSGLFFMYVWQTLDGFWFFILCTEIC